MQKLLPWRATAHSTGLPSAWSSLLPPCLVFSGFHSPAAKGSTKIIEGKFQKEAIHMFSITFHYEQCNEILWHSIYHTWDGNPSIVVVYPWCLYSPGNPLAISVSSGPVVLSVFVFESPFPRGLPLHHNICASHLTSSHHRGTASSHITTRRQTLL